MAIGIRIGPRIGDRIGERVGSPINPMAGVAQDSTSLKYVPATAAQWTQTLAAAGITSGGPQNLWLCQSVTSDLTPTIGAVTLTLGGASEQLNQSVPGWTRVSQNHVDGAAANTWSSSSTVDLTTTSALILAYVRFTGAAAAEREVFGVGNGTDHRYVAITAGGKYKATGLAGASVTGTATPGTTVHPVVLKVDRAATVYKVYTDQESLAPAWTAPGVGGALITFGDSVGGGAPPGGYLYIALFTGTSAQMSDSNVASLLRVLGW